ncbi:hypothetical protein BN10_270017 [Phycicoccus elongatus Lp2]|uniref:Uncharacterized protein n=1 Tax=Phycicoccus elongatus Lp2 TaxID=1193181 RepID=N0DYT2_9MICO|nr:hypothetical protein [Phycicoccus elongatus]CCH69627.1 hypothetical protein BN10_270017 [Phycicoccus elongatus Lp2]
MTSSAPFVLARPGRGVREALRESGIAVRRCDTFPGLDDSWVRIAVRPPAASAQLVAALGALVVSHPVQPKEDASCRP